MPLLNSVYNRPVKPLDNYLGQRQKDRNQSDPVSRSNTPSNAPNKTRVRRDSTVSSDSAASNPLGAKDVNHPQRDKNDRAQALKMDVPMGLSTRLRTTDGRGLDRISYEHEQVNARAQQPSTFDDTTSLEFNDESSLQGDGFLTALYPGESIKPISGHVQSGRQQDFYKSALNVARAGVFNLPPDFQEKAQRERELQNREQRHNDNNRQEHNQAFRRNDLLEFSSNEQHQPTIETPSRVQVVPVNRLGRFVPQPKTVSFRSPKTRDVERGGSPELELPRMTTGIEGSHPQDGTTRRSDQHGPPTSSEIIDKDMNADRQPSPKPLSTVPKANSSLQQHPHTGSFESSRASDYPTSSEDEMPPVRPNSRTSPPAFDISHTSHKRHRDAEIDYDHTALKAMKYDDLDNHEFGKDPRTPEQDVAIDARGNPITLAQRMNNLSRMSEDDQKAMFKGQGDEEWAQAGTWFMEKFHEDLRRLVDIRFKRRKISLKYEDEVRRHHAGVERCQSNVEGELRNLKKGGGELIRGKEAAGKRSTPRKQ